MKNIDRLLRRLTFVDEEFIITKCSTSTQRFFAYLGATILITGIFTAISSYIALSGVFNDNQLLNILFALMFGTIVTHLTKSGTILKSPLWVKALRMGFTVIILLVLVTPLEMKIMENTIDDEIQSRIGVKASNEQQADYLDRYLILDELKNQRDDNGNYTEKSRKIRNTTLMLNIVFFMIMLLPDITMTFFYKTAYLGYYKLVEDARRFKSVLETELNKYQETKE